MNREGAALPQFQPFACALAWLAICGAGGAVAQERPFAFGIDQTFTHEANLYRAADGQPTTSDIYSSTGVLGEVVLPLGRQRLYANGNLRENRFRRISALDNTSYGIDLGINWATAGRLSGKVNYALAENLAPFGIDNATRTTEKNVLQNRQLNAIARMGLVTQISLEASAQHRSLEYSAPQYAALNYDQNQGALGLRYAPDPSLTLGIGVRHARGRYPQFRLVAPGVYTADRYERDDVDLLATWQPTGRSTILGRLSYGRQSNNSGAQRSFSAATGSLSWAYQPSGKLQLTTTLIRDTGAETRFEESINSASRAIGNDQSRLSTGVQLAIKYDLLAKLQLTAGLNWTRRELVNVAASGNASPAGTLAGNDTTKVLALGARYQANRNWTLGCDISRERRSTDTALSYAYAANVTRCTAQFWYF